MRRSTVRGAGLDLAVTERPGPGPDAPVVVLVHGYPDTSAVWAPVADLLAARFRVVTYDVRGAGDSEAPTGTDGYTLDLLVADLVAVADAVSPDRSVHLVGHDWGSVQGWSAVTDPVASARIASYTSISGPSLDHMGAWVRAHATARPSDVRKLLGQGLRSWYVYAFHLPGAGLVWRTGLARRWARALEAGEGLATDAAWPAPTLATDAANGIGLYRANVRDRMSRPRAVHTDVPVQLVVPTRDPFVGPELAEGLDAVAPDLRVREVPAGHWVVRSEPEAVARWLTEHVDTVEARRHGDSVP
jgi:pimeloyl-ACP methyl ester carboxylesterase